MTMMSFKNAEDAEECFYTGMLNAPGNYRDISEGNALGISHLILIGESLGKMTLLVITAKPHSTAAPVMSR